jgi:hypothetical protein
VRRSSEEEHLGAVGSFAVRSEDIGAVGQGGGAVGQWAGRRSSEEVASWGSLATARVFGQHALKMLTQSLTRIVKRIMGSTGAEFSEEEHLGAVGQFCGEEEQWGSGAWRRIILGQWGSGAVGHGGGAVRRSSEGISSGRVFGHHALKMLTHNLTLESQNESLILREKIIEKQPFHQLHFLYILFL